jgi:hypothetical protein
MATTARKSIGPNKRKHFSYDAEVDEAGKLIDRESTDVEREAPADGNESLQQIDKNEPREPPGFQD